MNINEHELSNVLFIVRDSITGQKICGKMSLGGNNPAYTDQIYFPYIEELETTIKVLTDMYKMAMKVRKEFRVDTYIV